MAVASTELVARLRCGDWLTGARIRTYAAALLALELAIFAFLVAGTHGWIVPLSKPTTTDFVSFYAAGNLANAGTPALAYDHAAHLAAEEAVVGQGIEYQFFNYPPVYQLLFAPIAHLPYLVAFVLFEVATLLLYLAVARRTIGDAGSGALLALLAFPMVWWNIGLGQNAFLTAALFGAALLELERRPALTGICFGALCYKPHFALLVPLALACGGYWRSFAVAGCTAAALAVASLGLFGADTWRAFLATAAASHEMYESGRILFAGFVSPFGAMRLLGAGVPASYAAQAAFTAAAAASVALVWWRKASLPIRAAMLAAATLIAVPLALLYDLMLATVAACWLVRAARERGALPWELTGLAVFYAVLLDCRGLAEQLAVPVTSLAALGLFVLVARRAWVELGGFRLSREPAGATPTR